MSTTKQNLKTHNVIPDVLPENINLTYDMTVKWPNATLESPGEHLDREATQSEPRIYLSPEPTEKLHNLILITVDPDLLTTNDTNFGQIRHWLTPATFTPSSASQEQQQTSLSIPQLSAQTSPYIGPAPLPNYITPRPHRYVFILLRPTSSNSSNTNSNTTVDITPSDLREVQKGYTFAVSGNQNGNDFGTQDLKDRWGFNLQRLCEMKRLEVLSATMMFVGGDMKSAGVNAMMQGEAVMNKVLGR